MAIESSGRTLVLPPPPSDCNFSTFSLAVLERFRFLTRLHIARKEGVSISSLGFFFLTRDAVPCFSTTERKRTGGPTEGEELLGRKRGIRGEAGGREERRALVEATSEGDSSYFSF